jgi:hypothetical protein
MTHNDNSAIRSWLTGRLPDEWGSIAPATIEIDRDEITITVSIEPPSLASDDTESAAGDRSEAAAGRISGWREDTREQRMRIAGQAERRFERKVAWAARCDGRHEVFNNLAAPVMTRLRQPERLVLDTLVEANIARSRADAVAWCVRLVGRNTDEWLNDLRAAMQSVEAVRAAGPDTPPN